MYQWHIIYERIQMVEMEVLSYSEGEGGEIKGDYVMMKGLKEAEVDIRERG
jgi:hypothetical protein